MGISDSGTGSGSLPAGLMTTVYPDSVSATTGVSSSTYYIKKVENGFLKSPLLD
jgi:hypothetical protein